MTDFVGRLPFPPQPDESARGLIVRVAEDNLCSADDFAAWLGLPRTIAPLVGDPSGPADALGVAPDQLAAMGFETSGCTPLLGVPVKSSAIASVAMRICPLCLSERPYHRRIWELRRVGVCAHHKVELLWTCQVCSSEGLQNRPFYWARGQLLQCSRGHDLRSQSPRRAALCDGAAAIYRACGLQCDGPGLPAEFQTLPLEDLLDLLFFLGRMSAVVADSNPRRIPPRLMETNPDLLEAGAKVAFGWPSSFDDLCTALRSRYGKGVGVARQYGSLYRFLGSQGGASYGPALRALFAAHLARRNDIPENEWPIWLCRPEGLKLTVSKARARDLLGLKRNTFENLLRHPVWLALTPVTPGNYGHADILELKATLDSYISPHEAAFRLGLAAETKLVEQLGLLTADGPSFRLDGRMAPGVLVQKVEAIVGPALQSAFHNKPRRPVAFAAALAMAASRCVPRVELIKAIAATHLRGHVSQPKFPGLAALEFEAAELEQFLEQIVRCVRPGKVSLVEAARRSRMRPGLLHEMAEAGLIGREPGPRRRTYLFDAEEVAAVAEVFVTDHDLARTKRTRADHIRKALTLVGIKPAAVFRFSGVRQCAIYRRRDLDGVDVQNT